MTTKTITQTIDAFLAQLKSMPNDRRLSLLAAVVDLLNHAHKLGGNSTSVPVANFVAASRAFPWGKLDIFLSDALLQPTGAAVVAAREAGVPEAALPELLLPAAALFLNQIEDGVLESAPDVTQEELLRSVVAVLAGDRAPPAPAAVPQYTPEIYTHKLLNRVYRAAQVTPEMLTASGLQYGLYTTVAGYQTRAIRCDNAGSPGTSWFILESGETYIGEHATTRFVPCSEPDDVAQMPASLLISLQLAAADSYFQTFLPARQTFGEFTQPAVHLVFNSTQHGFSALDAAAKSGNVQVVGGLHFPVGTDNSFQLARLGPLCVRFSFGCQDSLPVITAQLVAEHTANAADHAATLLMLMRHDHPRHTADGFYLFPMKDGLVSVTVRPV